MSKKPETAVAAEKRHAKEAKELAKWEKIQSKPISKRYFPILIVVLAIIYCVDEITSNINSTMQPYIICDFFNIPYNLIGEPNSAYSQAIDKMFIISMMAVVVMFVGPFYKSLSDKYGRRLFLMINTVTFGVGLLLIAIAPNIIFYVLGFCLLSFVTPNDVQVMYIMETAPKEKRATLSFATKGIALVSVTLIGFLSKAYLNEADPSWWRKVYIIPVIAAVIIGASSILFTRETPVFLDERINYLRSTDEERAAKAAKTKESASANNGGVINAIKFMFSHKQIRSVCIAALLFSASAAYTSYYTTIMENGMDSAAVQTALIVYPFANGAMTFLAGFISDKLGRKKSCTILGGIAMVFLALFIFGAKANWGSYPVGIFYGLSIGGLWSMSDTLFLTIPAESVPTELRASVMGTMSLLLGMGLGIAAALITVLQNFINLATVCFVVCVPFMAIALFFLFAKVAETKDVDLDTVTGLEWD